MSHFGVQHADIANQALDSIGWSNEIGDLQDGSREARILLRNYAPTVEEISRAAHWNFNRRQAQLVLLQDATQQSQPPVGTGTPGMGLWIYEYAWPIDCLKARYVPVTGSINSPVPTGNIQVQPPNVAPTTLPSPWPVARTIPAPFLVSQDLVPTVVGAISNWDQLPDLEGVQGAAYNQQTVILTNQQNASMVYTSLVDQPSVWDPLFRQAVIQVLAAKVATGSVDGEGAEAGYPDARPMHRLREEGARRRARGRWQRVAGEHEPRGGLDTWPHVRRPRRLRWLRWWRRIRWPRLPLQRLGGFALP